MAVLEQIQSAPAVYMGWYGSCETEGCVDFSVTSAPIRDKIQKVFQVSSQPKNDGYIAFDGTIDASYDSSIQPFTSLECGKSYIVVLKPGVGSIRIDEFIFTDGDTTDLGRVIDKCAYDPTPTPVATPTPTPAPDPTPTPEKTPIPPALEFRWKEINGREVLQTRKILTPFEWETLRNTTADWSTVYASADEDATTKYNLHGVRLFQSSGEELVDFCDATVPFGYQNHHGDVKFDGLNFNLNSEEYYAVDYDFFDPSCVSDINSPDTCPGTGPILTKGHLGGYLHLKEHPWANTAESYPPIQFSLDPSSDNSLYGVFNFDTVWSGNLPGHEHMRAAEWCRPRLIANEGSNTGFVYNTMQQGAQYKITLRSVREDNSGSIRHKHGKTEGGFLQLIAEYIVGSADFAFATMPTEPLPLADFRLAYNYKQLMLNSLASHTEYAYDENEIDHPASLFICVDDNDDSSNKAAARTGHPLIRKKLQVPTPTPTPTPVQPDPTPTPTPVQPDPTPTPTPVVQPDPTPTPTPESLKLEFRWKEIADRNVLQVKNVLKPTHLNFANRDTDSNWSTLYAFTADSNFYSIAHQTWPDAAVQVSYESKHGSISFDGLDFSLTSDETIGSVTYKQLRLDAHSTSTEYLPNSTVSQPAHMFIFKGDNDDPNNLALMDNLNWPVVVKKQEVTPTPTPTPEPDADCCADKGESVTVVEGQPTSSNNVTVSTGGKGSNDSTWDGKMCWEEMVNEGSNTVYWIELRSSQGSSESLGTVLIGLTAKYEGQKFVYVLNSSGVCYTGDMLNTDERSGPNVWTPS